MPPQLQLEPHMQIKIKGERQVWFADGPKDAGYIGEMNDDQAAVLIALGMADKVEEAKPQTRAKKA